MDGSTASLVINILTLSVSLVTTVLSFLLHARLKSDCALGKHCCWMSMKGESADPHRATGSEIDIRSPSQGADLEPPSDDDNAAKESISPPSE